jgi:hypothetical protein
MSGFEQAPSILHQFNEAWTALFQYVEGCAVGVVVGVLLFQVARKIKASASWLAVPPAVSLLILPSIHASRVLLTAGVVATLIAVPLYGLKGSMGDFRIRDALAYRKVKIGLSIVAVYLLLQVVSVVVVIVTVGVIVLVLGGLARVLWKRGWLRDQLQRVLP